MGLLERGMTALNRRQQSAGATANTVTYRRASGGADIDITGLCWRGDTIYRKNPLEGGPAVVFGDRDYLIPVADLAAGGVPFEPARGDRITETTPAGVAVTFEVLPPFGEPEYRYQDAGRTLWLIHVQQVA